MRKWIESLQLHHLYFVIAIVWGSLMVVIMPPFQVPDEGSHFIRAWSLAEGQFIQPKDQMEIVPSSVIFLLHNFPVGPIGDTTPYYNFPKKQILPLLGAKISSDKITLASAVPSQNPVAYLPQASAIWIAKLTDFSPMGAFYLARFFNLLTAVVLTCLSISLAPWGKIILMLTALLPVTISEMASTSPDALMFSGTFLFTGICLNLSARQKVSGKEMLILTMTAALLLTVKPGYFPLAGMIFLISPSKFRSKSSFALWSAGTIAIVLSILAIAAIYTPLAKAGVNLNVRGPAEAGADATGQIKWVLSNPFGFITTVIRTMMIEGKTLAFMIIGKLGWLSIDLSIPATALMAFLVLFFMAGYPGDGPINIKQRLVLLSVSLFTFLCVCFTVYVAMAAVGGPVIVTLQGRYFTPVLPPLILGLYRPGFLPFRLKSRSMALLLLVTILAFIIFETIRAICIHYP